MNDQKTYKEILESYARQRDLNKYDRKMRKLALYEKIPRLKEIDLQMSQISSEIAKAILASPEQSKIMLEELKFSLNHLNVEKVVLLTEHNVPKEYLEINYECARCKDTGFTESGDRCNCFNQKLISASYKMSNIEKMLEKQNFDYFNLDVFSSEILPKERYSQRENMKHMLSEAESFVADFPKSKNLFFYGSSGLGKTYLCNCIAKALLDKSFSVIYQTPFTIIDILEKKTFTEKNNPYVKLAYDQLFTADLLIIDDLGTETTNTFTISEFYNIINTRLMNEKRMIISTNIKLSELSKVYNDRIDSRIKGHFELLKLYGPDIRWET